MLYEVRAFAQREVTILSRDGMQTPSVILLACYASDSEIPSQCNRVRQRFGNVTFILDTAAL